MGTGNTYRLASYSQYRAVQPRGYGEHDEFEIKVSRCDGSAPWVRGTLANRLAAHTPTRFSPVGTGNTIPPQFQHCKEAVQPRGYGEHNATNTPSLFIIGSAPWVRGTQAQQAHARFQWRFSPVGTGNTCAHCSQGSLYSVQPRGYGEHS